MRPPRSPSLRSKRARVAAGGLALLALIAQIGSVAHLAGVNHVACAEHGDLVEVSPDVDGLRALATADGATHTATQDIRSGHVAEHGHDHCVIAAFRRQQARAGATVSVSIPVPQKQAGLAAPLFSAPPPAISILALAPKNSPPRA
jgi:hypothetical protein